MKDDFVLLWKSIMLVEVGGGEWGADGMLSPAQKMEGS